MKSDTGQKKSMFFKEMEGLARELGRDVGDLLAEYRESVRSAEYPGPDCLEPHEIERYVHENELPAEREEHVLACSWCGTAVEAARPSTELRERFAAAVRGWTGDMVPSGGLEAARTVLATAEERTPAEWRRTKSLPRGAFAGSGSS